SNIMSVAWTSLSGGTPGMSLNGGGCVAATGAQTESYGGASAGAGGVFNVYQYFNALSPNPGHAVVSLRGPVFARGGDCMASAFDSSLGYAYGGFGGNVTVDAQFASDTAVSLSPFTADLRGGATALVTSPSGSAGGGNGGSMTLSCEGTPAFTIAI